MTRESSATYRIMDLSTTDRPRERLAELGAQALSNAELIAILLRTGIQGENAVEMGQRLLQDLGGPHGLHRASLQELSKQRGMGLAKASQIKAAIELGMRIFTLNPEERPSIHSPADAANLVMYEMSALPQEHLRVNHLDTHNRVINASTVRVGEIFRAAIQRNAAAVIILHNHPSGDPSPSPEDVALTRSIVQAGKLLDSEVTQMTNVHITFHASIRLAMLSVVTIFAIMIVE